MFSKLLTQIQRNEWLQRVASGISHDFVDKYHRGEQEHRGDLGGVSDDQLLKELYQEQLDSLAYLAELKRRHDLNEQTITRLIFLLKRERCGCLSLDCRIHGAYVAEDFIWLSKMEEKYGN